MSEEKKTVGISRRDFTKAAAISSFAILTARTGIAEDNVDTLRIGLIGCGGRGGGAVRDTMAANDNIKIVALADVFEDRVTGTLEALTNSHRMAKKVDITPDRCFHGLDAYKKLLALDDVDIVIHATPPYARPMHIEAAVEAGKHIFTEKPVAVDAPGIRRFMAAAAKAKEKNLVLVTGLQRRHQNSYIETMKQIHDGAIGDIRAIRVYWDGSLPWSHKREAGQNDLEYRLRNWYNYIWSCGDNIVEQHVHNLDIGLWLMGDETPVSVVSAGGRTWKPAGDEEFGNIWDSFSCDFEFKNGVHMASYCRHWNDSFNDVAEYATGTKGFSKCMDMAKDNANPYETEHADLIASITGKAPYRNEGLRTANSTFAAIIGRDAAYTGKKLEWDDYLANGPQLINPDTLDFAKAYPVPPVPVPGKPETFGITVS